MHKILPICLTLLLASCLGVGADDDDAGVLDAGNSVEDILFESCGEMGNSYTVIDDKLVVNGICELSESGANWMLGFDDVVIEGSLRLRTSREDFSLDNISAISGNLVINSAPNLSKLSFNGLEEVGGNIEAFNISMLSEIHFGVLKYAGGLDLSGNGSLFFVSLPYLEASGNLMLSTMGAIEVISLPLLNSVNGDFRVHSCLKIERLELPSLLNVSGVLEISHNPALSHCTFGANLVSGTTEISDNFDSSCELE